MLELYLLPLLLELVAFGCLDFAAGFLASVRLIVVAGCVEVAAAGGNGGISALAKRGNKVSAIAS